jgi:hypothetical protein
MTSFRTIFFRGKPDASLSRARRAGKKSNPQKAHERFKFIRIFFVLGIVGLLILLIRFPLIQKNGLQGLEANASVR